uniref:WbqC family protein n=1 Tax=Roseivirga sp. TaxID=1964215 RepID=UPI004047AD01
MNIVITQSNYIPWKGYFDAIAIADYFVVFDEMQYTRRDWRNRNKIKTTQGLQWLTVPVEVKGKYYQKISETRIAEKGWAQKHWKSIQHAYAKADCFKEMSPFLESLYERAEMAETITEVNLLFLKEISRWLGFKTEFLDSKDFVLLEDKTERLVHICKELNGDHYYTGGAAKAYMREEAFNDQGISLHYFDYSGYPEYPQLHGEFEHGVSILDMIFNLGLDTTKYMKSIL